MKIFCVTVLERGSRVFLSLHEFDREEEPLPADFADERIFLDHRLELFQEVGAHFRAVFDEFFFVDDLERGGRGR